MGDRDAAEVAGAAEGAGAAKGAASADAAKPGRMPCHGFGPRASRGSRDGVRWRMVVPAMTIAAVLAGCGSASSPASSADGGTAVGSQGSTPAGEVLVSAAASLTDAFQDMEIAFEQSTGDIDVVLNLAGSSTLREQVLEGAPADVFAVANSETMADVVAAGLTAQEPVVFATNRLVIAVPVDNPASVTGLDDFAREDLLLGLCIEGVPCGDFARRALDAAGVVAAIDTNEPDVRALLARIAEDELDAGITYVTDVASAEGEVVGIDMPAAAAIRADYPIATLADAPNPVGAQAFVDFVLGEDGRAIMARHGFGAP